MTLAGMGIEAGLGHQELGSPFAIGYALGCVLAVLAVRQSGVFTAVIQPPLLLFVAVPLAYYLFHNSAFSGLKEIAITCGYPLIERFPLMLFTTSAVLLIGLVRWYLAMSRPAERSGAAPRQVQRGLMAGLATKVSSAFAGTGSVDERPGQRAARPRHIADDAAAGKRRQPRERPQQRSSGGPRAPRGAESAAPGPRRGSGRRPVGERESELRRGRPREPRQPRDPRRTTPSGREQRERREYRDPYAPRPTHGSRYEPYETGRGYQSHPPYPAYPTVPPRRSEPRRGETHHPVSRVRYRESDRTDNSSR